jgi:hypothetical protein
VCSSRVSGIAGIAGIDDQLLRTAYGYQAELYFW